MNPSGLLSQYVRTDLALASVTPAGAVPVWTLLGQAHRLTIHMICQNGAAATASTISVNQAKDDAGLDVKPLEFDKVWLVQDKGTPQEIDVLLNTFDTDITPSVVNDYYIEVKPASLDVNDGFAAVQVLIGDATDVVVTALYQHWPQRYG